MDNAALNFEIKRKMFHLCSLIFPVIYIFTPKIIMCAILAVIAGMTLYLDISRHYNKKIKGIIEKFLGKFLRIEENSGHFSLTGASYMALGFLITGVFFSQGLAIVSWLVLIVSDCFAAVIGMKFGYPLFNGKSYAGVITFFVSAVFISIMTYFTVGYSTNFFIILISSFLTTLVEFFSKQIKINDNLSIPLTYSLSTVILGFIL
ncbi:MAG: SEC59/DGK1/VTE5 family protein [Rickettsiaceae bacterium]|nr:SEC59/DGK1/VTE5 family protein [Rickettsiaceae bacterium]MDP4832710.1 SEC59/DGK1/VTE5 family protein [Rickettsiaceae bacterium]MDP5020401.1 SEC59/DGK1/VTE5 family protein [Rickettsiaceae bacterium]MDP5083102.1 SEC59/DGK1/VTE5 family protein [Rickettsiaceae bacterium]